MSKKSPLSTQEKIDLLTETVNGMLADLENRSKLTVLFKAATGARGRVKLQQEISADLGIAYNPAMVKNLSDIVTAAEARKMNAAGLKAAAADIDAMITLQKQASISGKETGIVKETKELFHGMSISRDYLRGKNGNKPK